MFEKIAQNIVDFSLELKPGEKLNIIVRGKGQDFLGKEIEKVAKKQGIKTRYFKHDVEKFETMTDQEFEAYVQQELKAMIECDACSLIGISPKVKLSDKANERNNHFFKVVHRDVRLKKRWNLTSVPSREDRESEEEYQEMLGTYIKSCSIDYDRMSHAMDALVQRLQRADKVRIIAKDTDISFSIKGLPPVKCIGKRNLPDGEVYTAPVKDSVNGYITYNLPSMQNGIKHNNIHLEFKDGKIVKEWSDHTEELTKVLNTDEGARYVGEFSFGVNPYIKKCYNNTLYDEKISGTIHFTPGNAYERCNNGNKSVVHWDIVQSHTPEYGGGEIWFDDELIRKDGIFIPEYLKCLNPSQLISNTSQKENAKKCAKNLERNK